MNWALRAKIKKKTLTLLHFGCVNLHYCCCTLYSIQHSNWHALWHCQSSLWSPTIRDFNHLYCWVWHLYCRVWNNQCPYRYFKVTEGLHTCPLANEIFFGGGLLHGVLQHYPVPLLFVMDLVGTQCRGSLILRFSQLGKELNYRSANKNPRKKNYYLSH